MKLITMSLVAAASISAATAEELVATLPTEECRGYLFLPLTLESKENTPYDRTLHFLYDTGASYSIVDPAAILRVSGKEIAEGTNAVFSDATMGPLQVNRLRARVTDISHLSMALGRQIDGILAYDVFVDYLVQIDYPNREIRLLEGDLPRSDGKTVLSARGPDKRPYMRVDINGQKRRVLIDSGSSGTLALNKLDRYDFINSPVLVRNAARLNRIERKRGGRLSGNVRMGNFTIETPIITEVPGTELIGSAVLDSFVMTFDVDDKRVRLSRAETGPITVPSERSIGLSLRPAEGGMKVDQILPGGPAEGLDLQSGDLLTHFNGIPMATRGCASMAEPDEIVLTRKRGEDVRDVTVTVGTIID